jgi:hypothetical protein
MEIKNYPKEFVERTIRLLEELEPKAKEIELEVSFLLNCLLGMVVSVLENLNKLDKGQYDKSLFSIKLNSEELKEIIPTKIKCIKNDEIIREFRDKFNQNEFLKNIEKNEIIIDSTKIEFLDTDTLLNYDLKWLLNKIRNGIAHQNIMPTSENKKWQGIRIWNYNQSGLKDFAIEFNVNELRKFSLMVANKYLESLK